MQTISSARAESLLADLLVEDSLAAANKSQVEKVFASANEGFAVRNYERGMTLVHEGRIRDSELQQNAAFGYSFVPLGIVLAGTITVVNGNKGVKQLQPGDFVGLFETADWIAHQRTRQIGDWTLIAEDEVTILFFGAEILQRDTEATRELQNYLCSLARRDRVPKTVSSVPLLDWVASHTTQDRLQDCAVIVHTHIFPTSVALFRHLAHLVGIGNVFVMDKPYSTVHESLAELVKSGVEVMPMLLEKGASYESSLKKNIELLWQRVLEVHKKKNFKKILIIDDGGDIWLSLPWAELNGIQLAGVEQTQRGITRIQGSSAQVPPIVSVASSGVKKLVESDFIGAAVVAKLHATGALDAAKSIGILGMGAIGQAVAGALAALGRSSLFYDVTAHQKNELAAGQKNSADSLLRECDLIIGTTGTDSFRGVFLDRISGHKVFASASSADVEFRSLLHLHHQPKEDVFGTTEVAVHDSFTAHILNGGFPINFDREKEWEPAEDIALTRCLLYIGIMQAAELLHTRADTEGIYTLDQTAQEKTLARWLETKQAGDAKLPAHYFEVADIVSATFLENAKTLSTVWQD